ncbi:triose-phosphate isomerase [Candidatus Jorgensenbacteria bacterium RIFCSPLOWO2_12_FULL_42_11]|uniref:Triosephosphate isomerase n=1 Tax=Candidatus Jorgensenbacteria bacterium RIFCSPLOWO2_12_FULL_42_11 TaxID=1798473 RepID=A0A1F6C153_9BACT|nr:MAG: triose-phosphate isomerase [Candidatus Jorgensenbacteria bacterium RIFCSPLOWO2_12_FULL_42_11]
MNNKIIIANWKMNPLTFKEAGGLFGAILNSKLSRSAKSRPAGQIPNSLELIICPPFIYLEPLAKLLKAISHKLKAKLGSQDCFWEDHGAYTGEISSLMLKNLGVEYVIVGHSERRNYLGETDEMVARKVEAVIENGLTPVLCVGETLEQKKKGLAEKIIKEQLENCFRNSKFHNHIVIAYEPVWAIGTGDDCPPEKALEMIKFIKDILKSEFGVQDSRLLYGGSVDSRDIADYLKYPEIEGALVGGASLKTEEFEKIINEILKSIKTESAPK